MHLTVHQLPVGSCRCVNRPFLAPSRKGTARPRSLAVRAQDEERSTGVTPNSLFANNPQFAAAFQTAVQRQGDNVNSAQPNGATVATAVTTVEDERPAPHEEMVMNCLQVSRRNIRNFEAMEKTIKFALESEQNQFERLHFVYKKIQSDAAYLKHLERRLEQEKAKNQNAVR